MGQLKRIQLKGFKSIREMDLEFRALNVMIGANGSGKSNLISYFKMLHKLQNEDGGGLQHFVMMEGYANSVLHFGPSTTTQIQSVVHFEDSDGSYRHEMILGLVPVEQLGVEKELFSFRPNKASKSSKKVSGSKLGVWKKASASRSSNLSEFYRRFKPYHFDDTSSHCGARQTVYRDDHSALASDGRNLAAVLAHLRTGFPMIYKRIAATIRLVAPYFGEFHFRASETQVVLNWSEKGTDVLFGPHQISDGTLRAMCLITLLLLPDDMLPSMIIVDEPELGLHPYAIGVIASLFHAVAMRTQVFVSTQSSTFLDDFEPEDIIVVNRKGKESRFSRPDINEFNEWLERYSVSEVWQKNIFGGGPH